MEEIPDTFPVFIVCTKCGWRKDCVVKKEEWEVQNIEGWTNEVWLEHNVDKPVCQPTEEELVIRIDKEKYNEENWMKNANPC